MHCSLGSALSVFITEQSDELGGVYDGQDPTLIKLLPELVDGKPEKLLEGVRVEHATTTWHFIWTKYHSQ